VVTQFIFAISFLVLVSHFVQPIVSVAAASSPSVAAKLYVGLLKDNAVAVLDSETHRVVKTIPVPPGPHGLVAAAKSHKVYVSSDGASTVSVIDTVTDRVVNSIEVGPTPHGLAIWPDGSKVLVSVWGANQAVIIDTETDQIVGRVPVLQPHNSAISPDGRIAYVGSQKQGATSLAVLDLVNNTQIWKIALDNAPRALDLSPDGKQLYFTVAGVNAVQVLDTASNRVVGQIPVGASPHHPLFTPDGQSGLVVSQGPGELDILDPTTRRVSGTVRVGKAPHWIAVTSDGRTAYVTNEGSDDVSVVDLTRRQVIAAIGVGTTTRGHHKNKEKWFHTRLTAAAARCRTDGDFPEGLRGPAVDSFVRLGIAILLFAACGADPNGGTAGSGGHLPDVNAAHPTPDTNTVSSRLMPRSAISSWTAVRIE